MTCGAFLSELLGDSEMTEIIHELEQGKINQFDQRDSPGCIYRRVRDLFAHDKRRRGGGQLQSTARATPRHSSQVLLAPMFLSI
jgi:hypothetical protein